MNATADNLKDRSLNAFHIGTFGGHLYGPEHATFEAAECVAAKQGAYVYRVYESPVGMRYTVVVG